MKVNENMFINEIVMNFLKYLLIFSIGLGISACGMYEPVDQRGRPDTAKERARKNIEEGRGVSIGSVLNRTGKTNYEFSTSNPLWRASLETLDFLPMTTVDYSGGMIITDWYSDASSSNQDSVKITIRFLSNEVRSDSLKIIVHKKVCNEKLNCAVNILDNSKISQELQTTIIKKAAFLEKEAKKKKK